jgi:hypothetical protein
MNIPVHILRFDGHILQVNPANERMLGGGGADGGNSHDLLCYQFVVTITLIFYFPFLFSYT